MSSGYWQIKRQTEQLTAGNTTTQRVEVYCQTWKKRCYFDDIPDEVPDGLERSNRVPSYKSIAIAILKNDLLLRSIGFSEEEGNLAKELRLSYKNKLDKQLNLFMR